MTAPKSPRSAIRRAAWLGMAVLAVTLSGCGGSTSSLSLQLEAESLDLILGGTGTVLVTVTRSASATAPLSLQAEGAPDWMSVAFSPTTLSGDVVESTMTIGTDGDHPEAGPDSLVLTVRAVGTGVTAQSMLTVNVELLEVNGTLVNAFGAGLAGITVTSPGRPAVVTDANGEFAFTGMSVPYDVTVVDTTASVGHRFVGLTVAEPRILPISAILGTSLAGDLTATVTGNLLHASLVPIPAGHGATVCIEGLNGVATGCDYLAEGESSFDFAVNWFEPPDLNGRIRAYVYTEDANGKPTAMVAAGTAGPIVLADTDNTALDVTLNDSSSQASLTVSATAPGGFAVSAYNAITHYSDFASIGLGAGLTDSATETLITPFFAGAPLTTTVTASPTAPDTFNTTLAWSTGHSSGDTVNLVLPVPPTAISPTEGTTDVSIATEYVVANPAGGVLTFLFGPDGTGPFFATTTASTTATFPDLAGFGMGLPGTATYSWQVIATHHVESIDEAVTGEGYLGGLVSLNLALAGGASQPDGEGRISTSIAVNVTTQ